VKININITPTCFGVNTPSGDSLQLCWLKLWITEVIKYNIVVCCHGNVLVNVAGYVIVCVCVCVCARWLGVNRNYVCGHIYQ
jgi:hypothetical protein